MKDLQKSRSLQLSCENITVRTLLKSRVKAKQIVPFRYLESYQEDGNLSSIKVLRVSVFAPFTA